MAREFEADGELLEDFKELADSTSHIAEQIGVTSRVLTETQKYREKQLLVLMDTWEKKKPQSGLAKEFFTLGKGKDRIVFVTNPLIEKDNVIDVSYLLLSRKGFFVARFPFRQVELSDYPGDRILEYVEDPFTRASSTSINPGDYRTGKLLFLHSFLRNNLPGRSMRLDYFYTHDGLEFVSLKSRREGEGTALKMMGDAVGFGVALGMYQGIQARVETVCKRRLELLDISMDQAEADLSVLGEMMRDEKKKRG